MKHERKILNFIVDTVITILLVIVMCISLILIIICVKSNKNTTEIADFMGYKPVVCISNSMQDVFEVGDIVISKKCSEDSISIGDIITYREGENIVTHRVENIVYTEKGKAFVTKGDSNNTIDQDTVIYEQIEGKYCYKIPQLGKIILLLQKPQGFIIVFLIPVAIIAIIYKIILIRKDVKDLRKRKLLKRLQEKQLSSNKQN